MATKFGHHDWVTFDVVIPLWIGGGVMWKVRTLLDFLVGVPMVEVGGCSEKIVDLRNSAHSKTSKELSTWDLSAAN